MSEIRCTNCGNLNRAGAGFCNKCGNKLEAPSPPPAAWTPPPAIDEPSRPASPIASPVPSPNAWTPQPVPQGPPLPDYLTSTPKPHKSWWKSPANLAALVFALAFVFLASFALPVLNLSGKILNGELYKASLRKQDVYNRFPDLFAEQMEHSKGSLEKAARLDLSGVGAEDWKLIARELIPAQWMQTQVESLIDQIFAAAKKNAPPPDLKLNFSEVTQRLGGDSGFNIYKKVIQTKRQCSLDDLLEIIDWISKDNQARLSICNIPPDLADFAGFIMGYDNGDAMIKDILKELPNSIPSQLSLSGFFVLRMDRVAEWMSLLSLVAWICLFFAVLALFGTLISPTARTLIGFLLFWGIPLAVAGMILLVESQILPYALGGMIVSASLGSLSASVAKIILETFRSVTEQGASALFWQALVLFVLGLGMAGVGVLVWAVRRSQR